jgi:hypothetical protein
VLIAVAREENDEQVISKDRTARKTAALAVLIIWTATLTTAASPDLLKNGGFESFSSGRAAFWDLNGDGTLTSVPGATPKSRAVALVVADETRAANMVQGVTGLHIPAGTTLELTALYRTEDIFRGDKSHVSVAAKLNYYRNSGRQGVSLVLDAAPEWKRVTSKVTLREGVVDFRLLFNVVHCKGRFVLDKVTLRIVNNENQLTLFSLKKAPPLLDGELDDVCWRGAQRAGGLMPLGTKDLAQPETDVMSVYDDRYLYFGARAHEPNVKDIAANRSAPWRGDGFEFFIGPDGADRHYQFIVNCQGDTYAVEHTSQGKKRFDSEIKVGIHRDRTFWSMEVAIPLAEMRAGVPEDNQRWTFNIARNQAASGAEKHFSWAAVGAYTEWTRLGELAFYSRSEIDADIEYWRNADIDPLMARGRVSGYTIAQGQRRREPDLWSYFPFDADRGKAHKNGNFYGQGLSTTFQAEHPQFYDAAARLNRLILAKSYLDEDLRLFTRIPYYGSQFDLKRASYEREAAPRPENFGLLPRPSMSR